MEKANFFCWVCGDSYKRVAGGVVAIVPTEHGSDLRFFCEGCWVDNKEKYTPFMEIKFEEEECTQ